MMLLRGGLGRVLLDRHLHLTLPHTTYVAYVACRIPVPRSGTANQATSCSFSVSPVPPPTVETRRRAVIEAQCAIIYPRRTMLLYPPIWYDDFHAISHGHNFEYFVGTMVTEREAEGVSACFAVILKTSSGSVVRFYGRVAFDCRHVKGGDKAFGDGERGAAPVEKATCWHFASDAFGIFPDQKEPINWSVAAYDLGRWFRPLGGRESVAVVGALHFDRGTTGTGGGDGQNLVIRGVIGTGGGDGQNFGTEALRKLIFGDYPFDSNPAATGRSFLCLVCDYVMMVWFPGCAVFFHQGEISRQ
jgi:hypothetical protein